MLEKSLDEIAVIYDDPLDFDRYLVERDFAVIKEHIYGPRVLEMGCASGAMTRLLLTLFARIDIVDGSERLIDLLKMELGGRVNADLSLFEDYDTEVKYNSIIMAMILEHIDDPVALLSKAAGWLQPTNGAAIHIIVPNANSLHRHVGVAMGLIPSLTSASERDYKLGHKRVYTSSLLGEQVIASGLEIELKKGIFLKPLANAQMVAWPKETLDAFFVVGEEFPDICAHIYLKCRLPCRNG